MIDSINQFIMALASTPWALAAVFAVTIIDGFFPPVPSETLVVATGAAFATQGMWHWALLLALVAALGAMAGDLTAYTLGRFFKAGEWRMFRHGKGEKAFGWAERTFNRVGGPLLVVARYIPVGRVAVNLTAGSIRFPLRRFAVYDGVAALTWGLYSAGVGYLAGQTVGDNPLLGVAAGIVLAVSLGSLVQWIINRRLGKADLAQAHLLAHGSEAGAEHSEGEPQLDDAVAREAE